MPDSSFFGRLQRFAGQAYGALDRSVGGILPGGADNPYIGKSTPYFSRPSISPPPNVSGKIINFTTPSPFEKDLGRAVDAGASAVASVQPKIKDFVSNSPRFIQDAVSTGLNKLPVSVNLFGRYYTGLGDKGLELPQSFINDTKTAIQKSVLNVPQELTNLQKSEQIMQNSLNNLRQGNLQGASNQPNFTLLPGSDREGLYHMVNNSLAENRSRQNQLKAGNIAIGYQNEEANSANPFTSLKTSLGSAWFKPTNEGGWSTKEKYDFEYAGEDKRQPSTVTTVELPSPSQNFSNLAASSFLNEFNQKQKQKQDVTGNPATFFGRAVVAKMNPAPFDYTINIPSK
jgi:hypothetical protein